MTASVASASPRLTAKDSTTNAAFASRLRTRAPVGRRPAPCGAETLLSARAMSGLDICRFIQGDRRRRRVQGSPRLPGSGVATHRECRARPSCLWLASYGSTAGDDGGYHAVDHKQVDGGGFEL